MGFIDDIKSKKKQKEAENWFNMGIKSQDPEKKLNYFTKSLEINPNNVSAWVKKGKILEEMGKFDEAKNSYERANFLDPSLDIHIKKAGSYKENISITETVSEQEQHSKQIVTLIEKKPYPSHRLKVKNHFLVI
jgi:tetratricopeptide (TPR) repeat protein